MYIKFTCSHVYCSHRIFLNQPVVFISIRIHIVPVKFISIRIKQTREACNLNMKILIYPPQGPNIQLMHIYYRNFAATRHVSMNIC